MTDKEAYRAGFTDELEKLAFSGLAEVSGAPTFTQPQPTVGQMLYNAAASFGITGPTQRSIHDQIMATGKNVNSPASSLLGAGIGALAGNFISNALHMGPFMRGVMTATGANYGWNH